MTLKVILAPLNLPIELGSSCIDTLVKMQQNVLKALDSLSQALLNALFG